MKDKSIKEILDKLKYIKKYREDINLCKKYREEYILVDTGKEIIENFNCNLLPNFNGYKDPFVNQELKFIALITDLDMVNQHIIESHNLWNEIRNEKYSLRLDIYNTYLWKRFLKLQEYIIFDLKHFVDEVIATIAVIKNLTVKNKISVSSIGEYLNNNSFNELDEFKDLFRILNDLFNTYKHSYANNSTYMQGIYENCFVGIYSKYNDFNEDPQLYVVSMDELIKKFNDFYKKSFTIIDNLTKDAIKY